MIFPWMKWHSISICLVSCCETSWLFNCHKKEFHRAYFGDLSCLKLLFKLFKFTSRKSYCLMAHFHTWSCNWTSCFYMKWYSLQQENNTPKLTLDHQGIFPNLHLYIQRYLYCFFYRKSIFCWRTFNIF